MSRLFDNLLRAAGVGAILYEELKQKPNKTRKDKDNIELLEIKLKQVKNQK